MTHETPAILVLEDGTHYIGRAWGARGETLGEIVFNTGMTGYQETLTDPSYHRQIVVMTAPHVGNTGMNPQDPESRAIWVAGFVVRDPARRPSNWRARTTLEEDLIAGGIVGISEVDTRALTRHLRSAGAMRAGIFSGDALPETVGEARLATLLERVRSAPPMAGAALASQVTTPEPYVVEPIGQWSEPVATVVAVDLGIKDMTPTRLAERGLRVVVIPAGGSFADIAAHRPDGVFFSNGPGDPQAAEAEVARLREVLDAGIPYFGICFGNQILGRALGFGTYKLTFGHRGVNQPVQDVTTGKVEITAHNHGFAVDAPLGQETIAPHDARYGRVIVSHVGLNDQVVEGLACLDIPAFSVQYHPEAAAGPHDAAYLFDRFVDMITSRSATPAKENA
ncbi:glutamine-hydrolyzing carbamoyl-phosphate synthase small subunit [Serinibacter salmoneus]|uniref:Carbamoyl phosphate synthase small chain n=1 Tax=Serinibacter salmoneus TaxID=556530 RepID=A0A2A9CZ11_9MICO|nr:glutamine-hydrolyzing carbamoyl-phosphate synthase small subunit [Serinibacter salmoneus]PFG19643.1 carbamoyl-phosphate synthase small subunit [Serinibacter salmoneus]